MVLRAGTEARLLAVILRDAHDTTMTMTVGGRIVLIASEIAIESTVEIATKIKILAKIETGDIAMIDTAALDTRLIRRGQTVTGIRVGVGGTTSCQSAFVISLALPMLMMNSDMDLDICIPPNKYGFVAIYNLIEIP